MAHHRGCTLTTTLSAMPPRMAPSLLPCALAAALVLGTVAMLAWQTRTLLQDFRLAPATAPRAAAVVAPAAVAPADALFGAPAASTDAALPLRLLASFVAAREADSSALFALPDGRSRQLRVGEEIHPGVQLGGVWLDHVTLTAQGRTISLGFAPSPSSPTP